ncbi:MAG: hypothetical protein WB795_09105 [Candidatus Acidiferrales bacterium]
MNFDIQIQQFPGTPLAIVRRRATRQQLPQVITKAFDDVGNAIRAQKVHGAGRNVVVYLDHEMNLEIGVELDTPFLPLAS